MPDAAPARPLIKSSSPPPGADAVAPELEPLAFGASCSSRLPIPPVACAVAFVDVDLGGGAANDVTNALRSGDAKGDLCQGSDQTM